MRTAAHARDWEELAGLDPLWAIVSASGTEHGGWDLDEFMASGRADVERLLATMDRLGRPRERRSALDFGCGVGRHTRALAEHFERCIGVDVSEGMVERARKMHAGVPGLEFVVNRDPDLRRFADGEFDLVQSQLVLMHLPARRQIMGYLDELARVLRPGGLLVFGLPTAIAPRHRLQGRRRLYRALRAARVPPQVLYRRLRLNPVRMSHVPPARVAERLAAAGARILEEEPAELGAGIRSRVYYVSK